MNTGLVSVITQKKKKMTYKEKVMKLSLWKVNRKRLRITLTCRMRQHTFKRVRQYLIIKPQFFIYCILRSTTVASTPCTGPAGPQWLLCVPATACMCVLVCVCVSALARLRKRNRFWQERVKTNTTTSLVFDLLLFNEMLKWNFLMGRNKDAILVGQPVIPWVTVTI